MAGIPTSTDAAAWQDADPAASDSDPDMAGAPAAEAEDDLSPEDAAWVDSCLVRDGGDGDEGRGLSDDAWSTLTEAFIDALAYSASSGNATAAIQDEKKVEESSSLINGGWGASRADASGDEPMMSRDGLFPADPVLAEEEASSPTASAYAATFHDQPSPTLGGSSSGEGPSAVAGQFEGTAEGSGSSNGGLDAAAVIIGNEYPGEHQGYGDGEDEFSIAAGEEVGEVELTRDIFRVWELDVAEEEGEGEEAEDDEEEFGRQLKKALEGSSAGAAPMLPLAYDDPSATILDDDEWRKTSAVVPDDENLEELIAGISDISLGRPSSSD